MSSLGGLDSPEHRLSPTPNLPSGALLRNDSNLSFVSAESASSLEQLVSPTPPHTPLKMVGAGAKPQSILKNRQQQEDLYQWMAKQQEEFKVS